MNIILGTILRIIRDFLKFLENNLYNYLIARAKILPDIRHRSDFMKMYLESSRVKTYGPGINNSVILKKFSLINSSIFVDIYPKC